MRGLKPADWSASPLLLLLLLPVLLSRDQKVHDGWPHAAALSRCGLQPADGAAAAGARALAAAAARCDREGRARPRQVQIFTEIFPFTFSCSVSGNSELI